jgi:hypothetical protein
MHLLQPLEVHIRVEPGGQSTAVFCHRRSAVANVGRQVKRGKVATADAATASRGAGNHLAWSFPVGGKPLRIYRLLGHLA